MSLRTTLWILRKTLWGAAAAVAVGIVFVGGAMLVDTASTSSIRVMGAIVMVLGFVGAGVGLWAGDFKWGRHL